MTPLLILVFGDQAGDRDRHRHLLRRGDEDRRRLRRHLKLKTVNIPLSWWMAAGSRPSAIAGVWLLDILHARLGDDLDETVFAILAASLMVVGAATLLRGFLLADKISEREDFEIHTRHKIAAIGIGATTGFVIGLSSAGSGTLIAIMLISVFRLTPAARRRHRRLPRGGPALGCRHRAHRQRQRRLLSGRQHPARFDPGRDLGQQPGRKGPRRHLRIALGVVLIASGIALVTKADREVVIVTAAIAALLLGTLFSLALRAEVKPADEEQEARDEGGTGTGQSATLNE